MMTSCTTEKVALKEAESGGATGESIRWSRGLFRLWAVLSCFWIAGVLVFAFSDPQLSSRQAFRQPNMEEIRRCVDAVPEGPYPNSASEYIDKLRCKNETLFEENLSFDKLVFAARWYGAAALGFPLTVLFVGLIARWVLAGFSNHGELR